MAVEAAFKIVVTSFSGLDWTAVSTGALLVVDGVVTAGAWLVAGFCLSQEKEKVSKELFESVGCAHWGRANIPQDG